MTGMLEIYRRKNQSTVKDRGNNRHQTNVGQTDDEQRKDDQLRLFGM